MQGMVSKGELIAIRHRIQFGADCFYFVLAVWDSTWHYAKN